MSVYLLKDCLAVKRSLDKNNRVSGYTIMSGNGVSMTLSVENLKQEIREGKVVVHNLKITANNRLIIVKSPHLPSGLQFIQDKMDYEEYKRSGKIKGCSAEYVVNEGARRIELFRVHKVVNNTFEIPAFVSGIKFIDGDTSPFYELQGKLKVINKHNRLINMRNMFKNCAKITELDLSEFDMTGITDIDSMFYQSGLEHFIGGKLNLSAITNMSSLFYCCKNLKAVDIGEWVVPNVVYAYNLFGYNMNLRYVKLPTGGFPKLKVAAEMFNHCITLEKIEKGQNFVLPKDYDKTWMFKEVQPQIEKTWERGCKL